MLENDKISNSQKGAYSVFVISQLLLKHGLSVRIMPTQGVKSPYDLLVNDRRVEVKVCPQQKKGWFFNIHRHGVLDESQVDAYILRLENVPGFSYAIHLVIPAPIGSKSICITLRSLITRYGRYYNRFDLIGGIDRSQAGKLRRIDGDFQ